MEIVDKFRVHFVVTVHRGPTHVKSRAASSLESGGAACRLEWRSTFVSDNYNI